MAKSRYNAALIDGLIEKHGLYQHQTRQMAVAQQQAAYEAQLAAQQPVRQHRGHCLKCGETKIVNSEGHTAMDNGTIKAHGPCPDCGTPIHSFLPKEKAKESV